VLEKLAELQVHLNWAVPFGQPHGLDLATVRTLVRQPFVDKPAAGQKVRDAFATCRSAPWQQS